MLNIIYKDLYQARKTIFLYFLMGLIFIFSTIYNDMGIFMSVGFVFLMVYGVVARNEYTEDKNRGYSLLRTLPLKPYKIVISKYMTALILAAVSVLYYYLVSFVFGNKTILSTSMITIPLIGAGFALIFTGILYIFIYKYGASKAINLSRIFFFGFFFIPVIISTLLENVPMPSFIELGELEILLDSFTTDFTLWSLLFLGISLAIYLLTMLASINQFKKNKIM